MVSQLPGVLTKIIRAMVRPRRMSKAKNLFFILSKGVFRFFVVIAILSENFLKIKILKFVFFTLQNIKVCLVFSEIYNEDLKILLPIAVPYKIRNILFSSDGNPLPEVLPLPFFEHYGNHRYL